jgi:hypothetical protein
VPGRPIPYSGRFESPELLTLGIVYKKNGRFAGGDFAPFLKKHVDRCAAEPLTSSLRKLRAWRIKS